MSAPAQPQPQPEVQAEPAKKGGWGKKAPKAPKPPKPPKVRRSWGMAPWLFLSALLTGAAAVAVLYYPIPGLTAKPPAPPVVEQPKQETASSSTTLLQREQAVAQKEAELAALEAELKQKEAETSRLLKELGGSELANNSLRRAANMYTAMAPFKAAPLMAELPVETAVQILRLMSDEQAADIIAHMETTRGAEIMRELTRPPVINTAGG
ncbi:MAG: MotE family protein [Bacillota bacterium]